INWVSAPRNPAAADLDNIAKDLRTWGGNVDAASYNLANLGVLTFHASGYAASPLYVFDPAAPADLKIQGQGASLWWVTAQNVANNRLQIGGAGFTRPDWGAINIASGGQVSLGPLTAHTTDQLTIQLIPTAINQDGALRLVSAGSTWITRLALKSDSGGRPRFAIDGYVGTGTYAERFCIDLAGISVIGGGATLGQVSGTGKLHHTGDTARIVGTTRTPVSAADTGYAGEVCADASYLYVCTGANTWRRIAHASW
ncbi:MAG: hypothetical protein ABFE02_08080, partial [Sulfuricella sp.]